MNNFSVMFDRFKLGFVITGPAKSTSVFSNGLDGTICYGTSHPSFVEKFDDLKLISF